MSAILDLGVVIYIVVVINSNLLHLLRYTHIPNMNTLGRTFMSYHTHVIFTKSMVAILGCGDLQM
jgi:hypothetical protein